MKLGILGGGQLGLMLGEAAKSLGITCRFFDPNAQSPAKRVGELIVADYGDAAALERFAQGLDVITYEFENVPASVVESLAKTVPVFPPPSILATTQDRFSEKNLLSSIGIPVAPFMAVDDVPSLTRALNDIGVPAVLKTRRLGYDGKGQQIISTRGEAESASQALGGKNLIVEGYVPFDRELSIIGVRGRDGSIVTYPLVENHHRDGILRLSIAPAMNVSADIQQRADGYVRSLLTHTSYVGCIVIELFEAAGELLGNEIAPRVHNSGHWTIEGAATSQFANHVRAVIGMPLDAPQATTSCAMLNIIGTMPDLSSVKDLQNVYVHDYGKEARAGRKLGHITIVANSDEERDALIAKIQPLVDAGK